MKDKISLEQARRMMGFSQEDVANHLGIHRNTYATLEKEPQNITLSQAKLICELLDVSSDLIYFFDIDSTKCRV